MAAAVTSSPKISPHLLNGLLLVTIRLIEVLLGRRTHLFEAHGAPAGLVEDKDAPLAQRRLEHHLEGVLKAEHDCRLAALIVELVERGDHPAHRSMASPHHS
jgi:hypothetical protein